MTKAKQTMTSSVRPSAALTSGWRMGIVLLCLGMAAGIASPAEDEQPSPDVVTFKTLVSFDGINGGNPIATPVQGRDGNLYGTTALGLGGSAPSGNAFKVTLSGALTVLYTFCAITNCADGSAPTGLTLGTDGSFYGTTFFGGASGNGIVFKITPGGTLTTLYNFCSLTNCADGLNPEGPGAQLALGTHGNLYGTTEGGGANNNNGTVFKITPGGTLTTIYNFCSLPYCSDGSIPTSALTQATDGNFYGTTAQGGANGQGTFYKITPKGALTTLYNFCFLPSCTDGNGAYVAPVQAPNGDFYGITEFGGANGWGTIFKITPSGTLTTIYNFCSQANCADGGTPVGLVLASDGNFYGATYNGALNTCGVFGGCGTLFRITPAGTLTSLHQFKGTDGETPDAALVQATNGTFYGTTSQGGINSPTCAGFGFASCGTVFSLSVGLGPFVKTVPTSGKIGATIQILGTNLASATSVSFNGVAAAFTMHSKTFITATVPAGATTGFVTVSTPGGAVKGNVKFQVRP